MSVRSNEERLGIDSSTIEQNNSQQPTLEEGSLKFITPTEFVELPSKGHFYPPDHTLHNQEMVEIRHMTTKEEDILTSVTLLKKGIALDRMLESILVNKKICWVKFKQKYISESKIFLNYYSFLRHV